MRAGTLLNHQRYYDICFGTDGLGAWYDIFIPTKVTEAWEAQAELAKAIAAAKIKAETEKAKKTVTTAVKKTATEATTKATTKARAAAEAGAKAGTAKMLLGVGVAGILGYLLFIHK